MTLPHFYNPWQYPHLTHVLFLPLKERKIQEDKDYVLFSGTSQHLQQTQQGAGVQNLSIEWIKRERLTHAIGWKSTRCTTKLKLA